jgi:DNA-binding beta-propeller fold protein YncE
VRALYWLSHCAASGGANTISSPSQFKTILVSILNPGRKVLREFLSFITNHTLVAVAVISTATGSFSSAGSASLSGVVQTGGTSLALPLPNVSVTLFEATNAQPVVLGQATTDAAGRFVIKSPKDWGNGSVSQFTASGLPISGPNGYQGGPVRAQAMVSDAQGNIWIAGTGNNSVYIFLDGDPNRSTGFREYDGSQPFGIALAGDGTAWVTNSGGFLGKHPSSVAKFALVKGLLQRQC